MPSRRHPCEWPARGDRRHCRPAGGVGGGPRARGGDLTPPFDERRRDRARALARESLAQGDPVGWFDRLYLEAKRDRQIVPWADGVPNPHLTVWADRERLDGTGRSAVVVGCGYGDDVHFLADRGFRVTGFDLSPAVIADCAPRSQEAPVSFAVADLFDLPKPWLRSFDFVFEAYTIQALPLDARRDAPRACADLVAPGGTLLVVCRGRDEADPPGDLPWPLTKSECTKFVEAGLTEVRFEDYPDTEIPPRRRFRIAYRRPA